jgi:hypothetical protein
LSCEEDENVAFGLRRVNLEDSRDGRVEVVRFGLRGVQDVDRIAASGNCTGNKGELERFAGRRRNGG